MHFHAFHGVLPSEREHGNEFIVDFSCSYDISRAACTDELDDTVDYAAVYGIVAREMERPSRLLEHVAGRIADSVRYELRGIEHFKVKVTKLNPPVNGKADSSSVTIEY